MFSFVDKKEMEEITRNIVSVLRDTVTLLIESFSGDDTESGEVTHLGGALLDLLDQTAERVGSYDVRRVETEDESSLEDMLQLFYTKAVSYNEASGGDNKMVMKHFQLHMQSLKRVLDQDWNKSLPQFAPASAADTSTNVATPEKKEGGPLKVFEKFTPLKYDKITKDCPFCGQVFGIRSLENHIRQKHKEEDTDTVKGEKEKKSKDDENEKEDASTLLGTCKMADKKGSNSICGRRFPSDRIKRHLKEYHSFTCPKEPLRGFITEDGAKSYSPFFARKGDPDPVCDVVIQALDSSPDKDDEDDVERPSLVLEIGASSSKASKRLFSDEDEVEDESEQVDMSPEIGEGLALLADAGESGSTKEKDTVVESRKMFSEEDEKEDKSEQVDMSLEAEENLAFLTDAEESGSTNEMDTEVESRKMPYEVVGCGTGIGPDYFHDVVDIVCQDYEKRVRLVVSFDDDGQDTIYDINHEGDSDFEEGDKPEFSHNRVSRKAERRDNRMNLSVSNLAEKNGNKGFVAKFKEFMSNRGISKAKDDRSADKIIGHIISYEDSVLEYESKLDEDFFLDRLIAFKSDDFLALKFPLGWIKSTWGENPSRAVEKLKAHKHLREYIKFAIDSTHFGGSTDDLLKKNFIIEGVDRITRDIEAKGLYAEYDKLMKIENMEKRQARMTVNPSEAHNVARAVTTWNQSQESKEKELHFIKIYEDLVGGGQVKSRAFTTFGHYVRFRFVISDKSRPGSYHQLLNSDIATAKKLWWPEGYTGFGDLPQNWDSNIPPSPDAKPSAWSITVSGKY